MKKLYGTVHTYNDSGKNVQKPMIDAMAEEIERLREDAKAAKKVVEAAKLWKKHQDDCGDCEWDRQDDSFKVCAEGHQLWVDENIAIAALRPAPGELK